MKLSQLLGRFNKKESAPKPVKKESFADPVLAKILYQNTIDQTPYTPQARKKLDQTPFEVWGNGKASMQDQGFGVYDGIGSSILNPDQNSWKRYPNVNIIDVGRHENLHALDNNIWENSSSRSGRYPSSSYGFSDLLARVAPQRSKNYNYIDSDIERFAVIGSEDYFNPKITRQMPQELMDVYNQIYHPMTKNMNYSPIFPSRELLNNQRSSL